MDNASGLRPTRLKLGENPTNGCWFIHRIACGNHQVSNLI